MSASESARAAREDFFLGVDGGGSKTRAVVVDGAGVERGAATTGCSNYKVAGLGGAARNIADAAAQAGAGAGHSGPCAAAWVGLAGIDGDADLALLTPHLRGLARTVRLTNDAELLLAALPDQVGVALIAGTGSIAVGRNAAGIAARAGGWGHLLGDEGSGYTLGQQALIAALRAADGRGQPTILLERILTEWGATNAEALADRVYGEENRGAIAYLAPLVLRAAHEGDAAARRITRRGARELALAGAALAARLGADPAAPLAFALGGSLLLRDESYREAVLRALARRLQIGEIALVEQPALSAARAARALLRAGEGAANTATGG
ncbi:MAG TPA: BadF/BadG/BcrA/BcrD ATPase family protein [Ktedonobacterales bacterium]